MIQVASFDVARANKRYRADLLAAAGSVIDGQELILGKSMTSFEEDFAKYCGVEKCVGVGNGLDALALALEAVNVQHGDEVIVPAFTFIATWIAVSMRGATPVPVDVLENGLIDPRRIEAALTPRTRAIVAVHLFGRLADMTAIGAIGVAHAIPVIEDAAQAHGASRNGFRAGAFGAAAAFSFYPTKNLDALGDGGAVTTNDPLIAERVKHLRNYGSTVKYRHDVIGRNSRLDDIQAALLTAKLSDLDRANKRRRAVATRYVSALTSLHTISLPDLASLDMVWHQFVIRSDQRDVLQSTLASLGVQTAVHYPIAPFDQPCYAGRYNPIKFPMSRKLAQTVLSLPMADYLTPAEVERVSEVVTLVLGATEKSRYGSVVSGQALA